MKILALAGLAASVTVAGYAQHRTGFIGGGRGFGGTYGSASGFGNVVYPGTGRAPVTGAAGFIGGPFSISDPGFASRLANTVSGFPVGGGFGGNRLRQPVVYLPYAYPVYAPAPYEQSQQPNVIVIYPQPPAPVIINQNYTPETARPVVREYPQEGVRTYDAPVRSQPESDTSSDYFLIAFKDHSIYSAMAYWLEGETLHYVTTQGTHNQASLSLVDKEFTEQLNKDRGVQVRLR